MNKNADTDRFAGVIDAIDRANAEDPNRLQVDGVERPVELVYGERMTGALVQYCPEASDELRIAARGQHIRRWTSKRADYPTGRAGYLKWRADLKRFHADTLTDIMGRFSYGEQSIDRIRRLVLKVRLKQDADAQILEDVVCLVFLEHYFVEFAAKHPDEKVIDILQKTWRKMSARGHAAALALDLPAETGKFVGAALAPAE